MGNDRTWEQEEREREEQARREAKAVEAGSFICPWCQRFVDPAQWWTHINSNPYEEVDAFGPTLFHRHCAAPVPERKREWVSALRRRYTRAAFKPGDYVRVNRRVAGRSGTGQVFRVIDVETDEYVGVTEDDPYYVLDISDADPRYVSYFARAREIEPVGRPYLEG